MFKIFLPVGQCFAIIRVSMVLWRARLSVKVFGLCHPHELYKIQCLLAEHRTIAGLAVTLDLSLLGVLPKAHHREINQSVRARNKKQASAVIASPVISWLWGHNTVVHTVVVDSHTSLPSYSPIIEMLLGSSCYGQAASLLPLLPYGTAE